METITTPLHMLNDAVCYFLVKQSHEGQTGISKLSSKTVFLLTDYVVFRVITQVDRPRGIGRNPRNVCKVHAN